MTTILFTCVLCILFFVIGYLIGEVHTDKKHAAWLHATLEKTGHESTI
jgi:hypothetical protein